MPDRPTHRRGRTPLDLGTGPVRPSTPPHAWSVRGIDGPIRARVDLTVELLSQTRSRLSIAIDFDGHGIGRLLVPLVMRPQARAEMPKNLARLRQHVESRSVIADP